MLLFWSRMQVCVAGREAPAQQTKETVGKRKRRLLRSGHMKAWPTWSQAHYIEKRRRRLRRKARKNIFLRFQAGVTKSGFPNSNLFSRSLQSRHGKRICFRPGGYTDGTADGTGVLKSLLYEKTWPSTTALVRRGLSGACVLEK